MESHLSLAISAHALFPSRDSFDRLCAGLERTTLIDSEEDFDAKYELGEELGRGAFSIVYVVESKTRRPSSQPWAVKIILKDQMADELEMRRLRDECRALAELRHPNVIELFELLESPQKVYLLMERATGGELFDRIVSRGHFSEPQAVQVMRQLLDVLAFMHTRGVIHRDIKPENILLASPDGWDIKVSDFGLVKIFEQIAAPDAASLQASWHASLQASLQASPSKAHGVAGLEELATLHRTTTFCGTSYYMAPEIAWPWRRREQGYGPGVDVWSAGVVGYILLCGFPPWDQSRIPQPPLPTAPLPTEPVVDFPKENFDTVSAEAKDAIVSMLVVAPEKRPSASEVLSHAWLRPEAGLKKEHRLSSRYHDNMRAFTMKRARARSRDLIQTAGTSRDVLLSGSFSHPGSHIGSGSFSSLTNSFLTPPVLADTGGPVRSPPMKYARRTGGGDIPDQPLAPEDIDSAASSYTRVTDDADDDELVFVHE